MKELTVKEILKKLEYYCSYQERCYKEIDQKLFEYHLNTEDKEYILMNLIENKYINEERYAKSFTRGKHFYKNWGRNRIKQDLKFKDISTPNINIALKEIEEGYEDRFKEYAQKKWEAIKEQDQQKKKQKFISQLSYKGFESQLIFNFIEDVNYK